MEVESAPSNGKKDKTLASTSRITWGKHQTVERKIKTLGSTPKASWSQYLRLPGVSTKNWENDKNKVVSTKHWKKIPIKIINTWSSIYNSKVRGL